MKNEMVVNKRTLEELHALVCHAQKTSGPAQEQLLEKAQTKCRLLLGMDVNFKPEYRPEEALVQIVMPSRVYEQLLYASTAPFPKDENISAPRLKALMDFNAFHRDIALSLEVIPPDNFAIAQ